MDLYLRTQKDSNNPLHVGQSPTFWGQGENDLLVQNGDFALVQGVECLKQSTAKILVTEQGANTFFALYGSGLQSLIGNNLEIDFLRAKIKTEIIDALRIYQFINRNNSNLDEQVDTLTSMRIQQTAIDRIDVSFNVITKTGRSVASLVLQLT